MGGLLSRLIVTDSHLRFWDAFFGKPLGQVPIDPADKQLLERVLIFKHRQEVNRVIFISTPHPGSAIARYLNKSQSYAEYLSLSQEQSL
jgi:hypothetical protein